MPKLEHNKIYPCYLVDENGYYNGQSAAQCVHGELLMPEDAVLEKPELKTGYFYKYDKKSKKWHAERMPGGIADLVGIRISRRDRSAHGEVLRNMAENYARALGPDDAYEIDGTVDYIEIRKRVITVRDLKDRRLDELRSLKAQFESGGRNKKLVIKSSLGFSADADQQSLEYVRALQAKGDGKVRFKTADNGFTNVTQEELRVLEREIVVNKLNLLNQYWLYKQLVETAKTKAELENVKFDFAMSDFSK